MAHPRRRSDRPALRPELRARRVRDRVRGRRGRAVARPGPGARAGRAGGARPPRRVRGRRRVERRGRRDAAARGAAAGAAGGWRGAATGRRSGCCSCLAAGVAGRAARALVGEALATEGLAVAAWRRVPVDAGALGSAAAATRPDVAQAIVGRPIDARTGRPIPDAEFDRRLVLARRRLESAARAERPRRPVGRVDVVPDRRLQGPRRRRPPRGVLPGPRRADRAQPRPVPPALRDEHPADLAPRPAVPLDRPQRRDRHGPRQPRAGPGPDRRRRRGAGGGRGARPRRGRAAPLAGRLRLAVARRDDRAARRDRLGPGLGAAGRDARGVVAPPRAAPARGHAPAGDRRAARPVGRPGRDRLLRRPPRRGDPRPQRAPAGGLRGDVGPARRRRVGGRGDPPRRRPTRSAAGGWARARCSSSTRGAGAILEDADAKAHLLRRLPIHDAPRPAHVDRRTVGRDATAPPTPSSLRYLAGLDAEKARLDIKTMVVEAHEPLWSMGDDTPTPALGRVDRPVADHLRQAFAQVTNPPIDPEREKAVMDLRVDLGRRPALLGGPPRVGRRSRTIRLNRPVVADRDALLDAFPGRVRRLDATWPAGEGPDGLAAALDRLAAAAVTAAGTGAELVVLSDRSFSTSPAADPVGPRRRRRQHRAHRRRPPRPDRHPRRRGRRPRRPLARDDARRRRHGGRAVARGRAGDRDGRLPRHRRT